MRSRMIQRHSAQCSSHSWDSEAGFGAGVRGDEHAGQVVAARCLPCTCRIKRVAGSATPTLHRMHLRRGHVGLWTSGVPAVRSSRIPCGGA